MPMVGTEKKTSWIPTIKRNYRFSTYPIYNKDNSQRMLYSRCALPLLALFLMLEELSAFLLPDRLRQKRDVNWLDQDFSSLLPELSDLSNLSPGDAGETTRDWEGHHYQSTPFLTPLERLSVNHHNHHRRKAKDNRKKTVPLDSIGSSLMSNHRSRKNEPEGHWEYFTE